MLSTSWLWGWTHCLTRLHTSPFNAFSLDPQGIVYSWFSKIADWTNHQMTYLTRYANCAISKRLGLRSTSCSLFQFTTRHEGNYIVFWKSYRWSIASLGTMISNAWLYTCIRALHLSSFILQPHPHPGPTLAQRITSFLWCSWLEVPSDKWIEMILDQWRHKTLFLPPWDHSIRLKFKPYTSR